MSTPAGTIHFDEWDTPRIIRLSEAEAAALSSRGKVFRVLRIRDDRYRVSPRGGFVGACTISRDRQVFIHPKVPIENFYHLVWLGHRLQPLPSLNTWAGYAGSNASDWFTFLVLSEIESLLRGQLRNGYVDISEPLVFLRGRLEFSIPIFASARVQCSYADYQIDTPINRIIRAALEVIEQGPCAQNVRDKARQLLHGLATVSYMRPSLNELDKVNMDSTQSIYGAALGLIRLLFLGSGIDYQSGMIAAPGLFLQMDQIFERALYAALLDAIGAPRVHYQPELGGLIRHISGSPPLKISMRPDIVGASRPTAVIARDLGAAHVVIDAKYRSPLQQGRFRMGFRNSNVYQIMAYAAALGCRGILAYPKVTDDIHVAYRLGEIIFEIQTIDLQLPELLGLKLFAKQFALEYQAA